LGYTGVKFWVLPLKWLVTFTTVLRYRAACDRLRGFGVTEPRPPQTPFPILNVHRPYNSVSTTVLHCDRYQAHNNLTDICKTAIQQAEVDIFIQT